MTDAATVEPMITVTELKLGSPAKAEPGSIFIEASKSPRYAAILAIGGGGPRNALTIGSRANSFAVVDFTRASGLFLQIPGPRFVVDPKSMVTGSDHSPEPGTLFITPRGVGLLAKVERAEARVLLDGSMIDDTSYSDFVGFRHWRLEVDTAHETPWVVYSHLEPGYEPTGE